MILHNYDISPYSEKIRLMFGYTEINWQSAISPPNPPRPTVDPLVGGYRRIPVAQIGSDMFCDTRIIAAEIARISGKPELSFENVESEIREFTIKTNSETFLPIVKTSEGKSLLKMLITKYWPWQILSLIKDRANVAKNSNAPRVKKQEMLANIESFKQVIETKLVNTDFLYGESPCIADFAAYHIIWFADLTRSKAFLDNFPNARAWQLRMKELGHGQSKTINRAEVFKVAKETEPRTIRPEQLLHEYIGKAVTIKPNDYARDSVTGTLVGADDSRWIIAHQSKEFGQINVHFPVDGYDISVSN